MCDQANEETYPEQQKYKDKDKDKENTIIDWSKVPPRALWPLRNLIKEMRTHWGGIWSYLETLADQQKDKYKGKVNDKDI